MSRMQSEPHLKAILSFVGAFRPGTQPTPESFRAECDFGLSGARSMVHVELELPPASPQRALASIWLLSPELVTGLLQEDLDFKIYGGLEVVAQGSVLAVSDNVR